MSRAFCVFTRELNEHRSVQRLMQVLPSKLRDLIPDTTFIILIAEGPQAAFNSFIDGISGARVDIAWMLPASRRVHESQVTLMVPSLRDEPRFPEFQQLWPAMNGLGTSDGSLCILPLSTGFRRLGVVAAIRGGDNGFCEDEISLLTLATQYAALAADSRLNFAASEKARLQLENDQARLRLILDLNNSVVSNLDLKQLIRAMSLSIRNAMQLDAVALMLPAPGNCELEVYAVDFPGSKGLIRPCDLVSADGLPGNVFRAGKSWVGDISEHPHYLGRQRQ